MASRKQPAKKSVGTVDAKVRADVTKHGFHVIKVAGEGPVAPFAYTIGLETTHDHPEIVVFGLNADLDFMHYVLNELGKRIAGGERFEHGAKGKDILPGYVCPFARFPKSAYEEHLGRAIAFHGGTDFRAVQCIWPDPKKHLPWDPKVIPGALVRQPVFLRPDAGPRDPAWPFELPHSHVVITSRQVVSGKEPIRYVGRDADGDWQFVCETTSNEEDAVLTTLGWAFDHDATVGAAAELAPGAALRRAGARGAWKPVAADAD